MLLWLLQYIGLSLVVLAVLLGCFMLYQHRSAMKLVQYYIDQGFYPIPGYDKFPTGNLSYLIDAAIKKERLKQYGGDPIEMGLLYMMNES